MAEKRFGVDIRLIKELRFCQLNRKKKSKIFERRAIVSVNNGSEKEMTVKASYRRLTITLSFINNCCPPAQVIAEIGERIVEIVIDILCYVRIKFYSVDDKNEFRRVLGSLESPSSLSSNEPKINSSSIGSSSTSHGSQSSISSADELMLGPPREG